ncbi:hypothetical protein OC861_000253 [Tilletia horrida]|nr:hypothetical protein OC861_000253 [Tilletia horrida]
MRTLQRLTTASALTLLTVAVAVSAQGYGSVTTSTDNSGNIYTGTIAADGTVPSFTPVANDNGGYAPVAAGGGAGGSSSAPQTLQSISGYNPPVTGAIPSPTANPGSILSPTDIPGYTGAANGNSNTVGAASRQSVINEWNMPFILTAISASLGAAVVLL